jgi:hypothetical protein
MSQIEKAAVNRLGRTALPQTKAIVEFSTYELVDFEGCVLERAVQ